jgi:hypothetical protein
MVIAVSSPFWGVGRPGKITVTRSNDEMKETPQRLALRLKTEGEKTREFFLQFAPEMWDKKVYLEENGWNLRQLLSHFVSTEAAFKKLIINIFHGGRGAPEDFEIDAFNKADVAKFGDASPDELLDSFAESRSRIVNLVMSMEESDLAKMGRHPFLGITSLEDIIKMVYMHNQIHMREIRRSGMIE